MEFAQRAIGKQVNGGSIMVPECASWRRHRSLRLSESISDQTELQNAKEYEAFHICRLLFGTT
jgi:hypothetical protein